MLKINYPLPITLNNLLEFSSESIKKITPSVRTIKELEPVLKDSVPSFDCDCYFMYRQVELVKDSEKIKNSGLRFDLTLIPSKKIGEEFNKTFGHFHPKNSAGVFFPEVYEVIFGEAIYLLQKIDDSQFIAIHAKQGDKVIIPPGFGHVTINPSTNPLLMSNWIEATFKSNYSKFKEKKGAMYYFTEKGFEKNPNYEKHATLIECNPINFKELGATSEPMYSFGVNNLESLDYLKHPESYLNQFEEYLNELLKK